MLVLFTKNVFVLCMVLVMVKNLFLLRKQKSLDSHCPGTTTLIGVGGPVVFLAFLCNSIGYLVYLCCYITSQCHLARALHHDVRV